MRIMKLYSFTKRAFDSINLDLPVVYFGSFQNMFEMAKDQKIML
jgi:hypothetical protein